MQSIQQEQQELEQANCHIVDAENRIESQRALIARLEAQRQDTQQSHALLATLLDALELMKKHRRQIVMALADMKK